MSSLRRRVGSIRIHRSIVVAAVIAALAGATVVYASSTWKPGTGGVIHACRNASSGALRVLNGNSTACRSGEQRVSWEQFGNFRAGAGRPASSLGIAGDVYLDTTASVLYGPKRSSGWGVGRPLAGAKGADGRTVLSGSGAPTTATGIDGDFWIDTSAWAIFGPKAGGAWPIVPTALIGAKGDTGAAGPKGDPGLSTGRALFSTSVVDAFGDVGSETSTTIGTDGLGLVSYFDTTRQALKVAHCRDSACTSASTATVAGGGQLSSIAIGADGLALISAYAGRLRITHCQDAACTTATSAVPDTSGVNGQFSSIAVGVDGLGIVSYYDATNLRLKVAHCDDLACTTASIAMLDPTTVGVGAWTSIAIGSDGLALISYQDVINTDLKVAHCDDLACTSATYTTVDRDGGVGSFTSLAIGADGLGLISATSETAHTLKVSHCEDVACTTATTTVIDVPGHVGYFTSTTIGADGLGLVSYANAIDHDLRVAHCTNIACTSAVTATVDDGADVGTGSSITIGADGLGLVSYYDATNGDLKVAHLSNVFGLPFVRRR